MKFTLTTDSGSYKTVNVNTLAAIQEHLFISGQLLLYLENHEFEDKVLEGVVKHTIDSYNNLYKILQEEYTGKVKSEDMYTEKEEIIEDIFEEVVDNPIDNVVQFPFGKK